MSRSRSNRRRRGPLLVSALWSVILVVTSVGLAPGNTAAAQPLTPTSITVAASTDNTDLGGAVPDVLVAAGQTFRVTVTLSPPGTAFNTATKLNLTASLAGGGRPGGALTPTSVVMPGGVTTQTFAVSYSAVDNGVQVTVSVAKAGGKVSLVTPGTTAPFNVLKVLDKFPSTDPRVTTGLGVGDADCTQATTESECGTLLLSHSFSSQSGALSLGACTPDLGCTSGSQVVQFIADLGTSYSPTDPAVLIIRCSKEQCRGKGVNSYTLKVSFAASGPLSLVAAPCVSKGVALDASGNDFCTDYVQSHRDNAGDALLLLLFTHDMRGST
ncbi:MAG: hypothetical protein M3P23_06730 [Actinomycetota bacterium]|nr:hypothetical protein [Actinomycetota bacterium]